MSSRSWVTEASERNLRLPHESTCPQTTQSEGSAVEMHSCLFEPEFANEFDRRGLVFGLGNSHPPGYDIDQQRRGPSISRARRENGRPDSNLRVDIVQQ